MRDGLSRLAVALAGGKGVAARPRARPRVQAEVYMSCSNPGYWRTFGAGAANYFVIWAGTGIGAALGYQRELARLEARPASEGGGSGDGGTLAGARFGAADDGLVQRTSDAIQGAADIDALAVSTAKGGLTGALVAIPIGLLVQLAVQRDGACKPSVGRVVIGNVAAGLVGLAAMYGAAKLNWPVATRTAIGAALPFATTPIRQAMLRA
ncbi:MAG: hypothetical protein Q8S13_09795 [Dehalococcoidia bacterium]|nr:hypothetical protein [Dehalococcoidia bacterium]